MKTLTTTMISLMLVIVATTTPASAEPASVLLQEGLYAEEIEGDLDAAIKIYEKIIAQAEQTQQTAAMAMYRIGICRLKKGDKTQAAQQFQQLIEKFPGQKAILAKVRSQLAKIQPAAAGPFGPVIERVIYSEDSGKAFFFDLDAVKAFSPPEGLIRNSSPQEVLAWGRKNGIDLVNDRGEFELADMIAVKVSNGLWDSATPAEISGNLKNASAINNLPTSLNTTYAFKTREGGSGLLQILEKKDNNLRIRYKMLQRATLTGFRVGGGLLSAAELVASGKVPGFTANIFDNSALDLDTGALLTAAELKTQPPEHFDIAYDNDGGGALMIMPGSPAKILALPAAKNWEDAVSMARGTLQLLGTSTSKGLFASQSKFVAVLTTEGNLAVIEIGQYSPKEATLSWWLKESIVSVFGSVQTAIIYDMDHPKTKGKRCTIDLDTDLTARLPVEQLEASGTDMSRYLAGEGVDALGEFAENKASLIALGMVVEVKPAEAWDTVTPAELLASLSGRKVAAAETKIMQWNDKGDQSVFAFLTREGAMGLLQILSADEKAQRFELRYKMLQKEKTKSPIDLSTPEATIKSFVKAVYDANLEAAGACVSKDGHDYDEFKEMLATESNHPFQAMIKAMDVSVPVEITSKSIKDGKCKISWYLTLGRVYYFGETKMKKGMHQEFSSYLELVGDKWLIRDI